MKRILYPDKSYSWLQFPVALKGYTGANAHLTLKFFGEAILDHFAIERRVGGITISADDIRQMKWTPQMWESPYMHNNHYVLEFTEYPGFLNLLHNVFDIIKDQYIPWKPHITVDKKYFLLVDDQRFTPSECIEEFGEVELCLGGPNL